MMHLGVEVILKILVRIVSAPSSISSGPGTIFVTNKDDQCLIAAAIKEQA